ncbi:MAG: hypothetical protein GX051_05700 [Clostridiales bacterium]|nr:hypothetical protein [Clostridiales bacterium]
MLELDYALNYILKGIDTITKNAGFKADYPDGVRAPAAPIFKSGDTSTIMLRGDAGRIKIRYSDGKVALYIANADEADTPDEDMTRASLSLLELDNYDERDARYIIDDFTESIEKAFGSKVASKDGKSNTKLPAPVSKAAAKSGMLSYDANTLANRFTAIYPDLREEYKKNVETYGEFLAEEFFNEYGTKVVIDTIRENNKIKMRKLFNLLNDIYEDGTNETQSLVAVTILGAMNNDAQLIENSVEYMSETMREPVLEVNKYLASGRSKSARMRLENPPLYKPKKQKKKGMLSQMLGM